MIESTNVLLLRAENLNYEFSPDVLIIRRYYKSYNLDVIDNYMECNSRTIQESVLNTLQNNNNHLAIHNFNNMHSSVHTPNSTKIKGDLNNSNITVMNEAYLKFKSYCDKLTDGTEQSLTDNKSARKAVTHSMLKGESEKWHTTLQNKNSTELWSNIDWKGN